MSRRALVWIVSVAALLLVAAPASALPSPLGLSAELGAGQLSWKLVGVPDLDQIRATSSTVAGLPGDGTQYCAPTAAVNLLSYLARAGFRTGVDGTTDFAAPDGYTPATDAVRAMGVDMSTSATGGTGFDDHIAALESRLGRRSAIGGVDFTWNAYYSATHHAGPTARDLAEIGLGGGLANLVIGWYDFREIADGPPRATRKGGHIVTLTSVSTKRPYASAQIGVNDPWTQAVRDTTQSPFFTESYGIEWTRIAIDRTTSITEYDIGAFSGTFQGGLLDGFVAMYPERYLISRGRYLLRFTPEPFLPEDPVEQRYDLGSAVVDATFSPRTGRPYAVLADGAVIAVGVGPGGKDGRTPDQRLARVKGATSIAVTPGGEVVVGAGSGLRVVGEKQTTAVVTSSPVIDVVVEPTGAIVALTGQGRTIERFDVALKRGAVRKLRTLAAAIDLDAKGTAVPSPVVKGADAAFRDDHGGIASTAGGVLSVTGSKPVKGMGRILAVQRGWELHDARVFPGPIDTEFREPAPAPPPLQPQP